MNLDLGSFAFGSYLNSGSGTPSWGTALGQSKPDYKFTYPGSEVLLVGMVYCSVPLDNVSLPLGKGGHIYQASELEECQVASLFRKVYINGIRINYPFVMVLVKENSDSHSGRKSIKYSDKNAYQSDNEHFSNQEFIRQARISLGLTENACWFVYSIEIYNQDELHMFAVVVDKDSSMTYANSSVRRDEWTDLIPEKNYAYIDKQKYTELNSGILQQIFYGAPGTGKSHIIKEQTKGEDVIRTTFHPDTDYSTFVGTYKPTTEFAPVLAIIGDKAVETGREEKRISYEFVCQAFLQAYIAAWKKVAEAKDGTPKKQYLVIEEINRGNCAQIFGDLFQLLDRNDYGYSDYPIKADADMQRQLKQLFEGVVIEDAESINSLYDGRNIVKEVLSGEVLLLPNNLYIWATMNTSDQSLFPIDSAFKRRWDWQYMPISEGRDKNGQPKNWKIEADTQMYDWWSFIQKINDEIYSKNKSEDKKLGYYFCKPINGVIKVETFVSKVLFYLWNDVFKDFDNESGIFAEPYDKFYGTDTKGEVVIARDKVQSLLDNLHVEVAEIIGADENESASDESDNATTTESAVRDKSVYSINGEGNYVKKTVPLATVTAYVKNYPDVTASELVETWYALGTMIRQIVISKESYEQKLSKTSDAIFAKRSLNLSNGEVVYVYNQFTPERINDFISKVNEQSWDIHIEKVAE